MSTLNFAPENKFADFPRANVTAWRAHAQAQEPDCLGPCAALVTARLIDEITAPDLVAFEYSRHL